jgi:hypothetical protein
MGVVGRAASSSSWFVGAGVCLLVVLVVFGAWLAEGAHFVTQYQTAQTISESDEFGDVIERTVMVDDFRFGLLPDKGYDAALPYFALFGVGAIALGGIGVRRRRAATPGVAE